MNGDVCDINQKLCTYIGIRSHAHTPAPPSDPIYQRWKKKKITRKTFSPKRIKHRSSDAQHCEWKSSRQKHQTVYIAKHAKRLEIRRTHTMTEYGNDKRVMSSMCSSCMTVCLRQEKRLMLKNGNSWFNSSCIRYLARACVQLCTHIFHIPTQNRRP